MPRPQGTLVVARNKKAFHDYVIDDRFEAGLVLTGTEVKSLRQGRISLAEAYATIDAGEVWLRGVNIPEYLQGSYHNHAAKRPRKLLLNRREITKLERLVSQAGRTLIPLSVYFKDGYAKVELAVATGKRTWDKRQAIAQRDADRAMQRALANRNKARS